MSSHDLFAPPPSVIRHLCFCVYITFPIFRLASFPRDLPSHPTSHQHSCSAALQTNLFSLIVNPSSPHPVVGFSLAPRCSHTFAVSVVVVVVVVSAFVSRPNRHLSVKFNLTDCGKISTPQLYVPSKASCHETQD